MRFLPLLFTAATTALLALPAAAATLFQPGFELAARSERVFARPHDLVLSPDGRFLLVSDLGHDEVKIVDPTTLKVVSSLGKGELAAPHDVAFLDATTVLVADTSNDRIAVYDFQGVAPDGKAKAVLTASWRAHILNPEGVAVAPGGDFIYVTNVGHNSLVRLDRKGNLVNGVGGYHPRDMISFTRPHDVAVHADGRVFVADSGDDRMVVLNRELVFLRKYKGSPWDFDDPKYMAFDAAGGLWLADEYNSRILHLDGFMNIKQVIGTGKKGDGPGQLNWPEGVEVKGDLIWISDTYNDRILLLKRVK
ncbi:MAG: hypothetical protein COW30_05225 [Rhodospirillales bacterium CG15_BIG_FIL_POST_REV_8_21_14_020_66_15]|nr:MAG: hypothetical protein COW30_05225 [Rhodospirillales bacterium CG15_BIG_FIL_POST_REV_8_21_14_020_66_15]